MRAAPAGATQHVTVTCHRHHRVTQHMAYVVFGHAVVDDTGQATLGPQQVHNRMSGVLAHRGRDGGDALADEPLERSVRSVDEDDAVRLERPLALALDLSGDPLRLIGRIQPA